MNIAGAAASQGSPPARILGLDWLPLRRKLSHTTAKGPTEGTCAARVLWKPSGVRGALTAVGIV